VRVGARANFDLAAFLPVIKTNARRSIPFWDFRPYRRAAFGRAAEHRPHHEEETGHEEPDSEHERQHDEERAEAIVKGQIDEPGKAPTTPAPWVWVAYGLSSGAPSCAGSTSSSSCRAGAEQHAREHHDAAGVLDLQRQ